MGYELCGAAKIISKAEQERFGYQDKIKGKIVLRYKIRWSDELDLYYYCENNKSSSEYKILYNYMVDEIYTLDEAREKFPELFL